MPSLVAAFDYWLYLYRRKQTNSAEEFFKILFSRASEEQEVLIITGQLDSQEMLEIKEKELKNIYEKFCYLNHYTELKLSDEKILKILEQIYGKSFFLYYKKFLWY